MFIAAINHEVSNYDQWKAVFDEFPKADKGVLFHRINRLVDNPNNITVVHGFDSAETAVKFVTNPELKEAMGRAGATSAPRIEIFEEVEAEQY